MNKTSTKKNIITSPTKKMKTELNNYDPFEPEAFVINNILNYSKALSVRKSKIMDHIEMVLN